MQARTLEGGFTAPATEAAHAFRAAMEAMARPGTLHRVSGVAPPAPLSPAAGAIILTLCDMDTPVYLAGQSDCEAVRAWRALADNYIGSFDVKRQPLVEAAFIGLILASTNG